MNQKLQQFKVLLDAARRAVENQYLGYPIDLSTPHLIRAALEAELNHFRMRGIVFQDFPYEVTCNRSNVQVTLLVTEADLGIDMNREQLQIHKQTHDKSNSWWLNDARGIPLTRVCEHCEQQVIDSYPPEVTGLQGNYEDVVEEQIEDDY